LIEVVKIAYNK